MHIDHIWTAPHLRRHRRHWLHEEEIEKCASRVCEGGTERERDQIDGDKEEVGSGTRQQCAAVNVEWNEATSKHAFVFIIISKSKRLRRVVINRDP